MKARPILVPFLALVGALFLVDFAYSTIIDWGKDDLRSIAHQKGLCAKPSCDEEFARHSASVAATFKVSETRVYWCLGVDTVARTRVSRGGLIKSGVVALMNIPCGWLTDDDKSDGSPIKDL